MENTAHKLYDHQSQDPYKLGKSSQVHKARFVLTCLLNRPRPQTTPRLKISCKKKSWEWPEDEITMNCMCTCICICITMSCDCNHCKCTCTCTCSSLCSRELQADDVENFVPRLLVLVVLGPLPHPHGDVILTSHVYHIQLTH